MSGPSVSVITLHRVHNFGSALQAYATQRLLTNAGARVEVVDYWRPTELPGRSPQMTHNFARWNTNLLTRNAYWALRGRSLNREHRNFESFVQANIALTRSYHSDEELMFDPPKSDIYCVGSDQVWNDDYNVAGSSPFFLEYAPEGASKFSLAASFGKKELNAREREYVTRNLSSFRAVSVREQSAVEILDDLGFAATHVIDPTLGLVPSEWLPTGVGTMSERRPYLLVYQLHRGSPINPVAQKVAKLRRLDIVTVQGFRRPAARQQNLSNTSVSSFLQLIRGAAYVVTDSFHGTAFSLNFGKPFNAVYPARYSERITSLLAKTGTLARAVTDQRGEINADDLDVDAVADVLSSERAVLSRFMRDALAPAS